MRVLFIGGTGEISFACVEAAKRAGHAVTLFNRGKAFDAARLGVEQWVVILPMTRPMPGWRRVALTWSANFSPLIQRR